MTRQDWLSDGEPHGYVAVSYKPHRGFVGRDGFKPRGAYIKVFGEQMDVEAGKALRYPLERVERRIKAMDTDTLGALVAGLLPILGAAKAALEERKRSQSGSTDGDLPVKHDGVGSIVNDDHIDVPGG